MNEEKKPAPDTPEPPPENSEEASDSAAPEKEIDLNALFPGAENDLNALFPDDEIKHLLKRVRKNKKELHQLKDRFLQENDPQ
ncbi:MAG: hypothetical protein ACE5E9_13430 [Nitrospinaceae bacterium]